MGTDIDLENRYGSLKEALGNTEPGDSSRYRGRGYAMIAGRINYERMNKLLGLAGTDSDLVKYPEKALDPQIAYRVLSIWMMEGRFNNGKLGDFITNDKTDYYNARRILNGGLGGAKIIADDARKFEAILRDSLSQGK